MPDTGKPNRNHDRIWDVLIEDALKAPVALPAGRRAAPRPPRRRVWAGVTVTALCSLLIAGALLFAFTRPPAATPDPGTADVAPAANQADSQTRRTPEREPEPHAPSGNQDKPDPKPAPQEPSPEPEPPKDTPKDPPREAPEPAPEPTPEPPRDTVEKPEPDNTAPVPAPDRGPRITLLRADRNARLKVAAPGKREFRDAGDTADFDNGCTFSCDKPVDLRVAGVFLRLQGELAIDASADALALTLLDHDVYIDSRGTGMPVSVAMDGHAVAFATGAVLLEEGAASDQVSVLDGEVSVGDETITRRQRATLKKRGVSAIAPITEDPALLRGLADRVLYREDFDAGAETRGRLLRGELRDGLLVAGASDGQYGAFWGYPRNLDHVDGAVLRLRVRISGTGDFDVTQFCPERNDNFSTRVAAPADGWHVLELRLADFRERTEHKHAPAAGETFKNVNITVPQGSVLEIDWIELIGPVK
ncbi:MAG: hypothetical protein IPK87_12380 [Planctomycetes bacterium]|nr:hypothetical protein [Planctomycetota bacterium]